MIQRLKLAFTSNTIQVLLSLSFLMLLWWLIAVFGGINKTLLAHPAEVWEVIVNSLKPDAPRSERVFRHAYATIALAFQGWGYSMIIGVIGGLLFSLNRSIIVFMEPIVDFFRSIPPILAFPVLLVGFNYDLPAYAWTIVFGSLPIVLITIAKGIVQLNRDPFKILELARAKKVFTRLFFGIELLPTIFLAARLSFSFSLIIAIVCEMVFTPRDGWALGALARDSEINFDTPMFYASVLIIGTFGFVTNQLLIKLEKSI